MNCRACENLRSGWSPIDEGDVAPQCIEHTFGVDDASERSWAVTAALIVLFFLGAWILGIGLGWLIDVLGGGR